MQHHLVVQDCFNSIVRLRESAGDAASAADVHALLMAAMQRMLSTPNALGLPAQDVQDIAFCIAALADEVAMRGGEQVAELWQDQKLQTHFFNHHGAGELFYERLGALRQQPGHPQVIFAYYTALALGFEGKLTGVSGAADIKRLTAELRRLLEGPQQATDYVLSPHALSPARPASRRRLVRAPAAALLVLAGLTGLLLLGLQTVCRAQALRVAELAHLRLTQVESSWDGTDPGSLAAAEESP